MKEHLVQLIIFYHVADARSFTAAAKKLGMSKAYVSNQINQLETRTHTKLLNRNTRRLELTYVGEQLFEHCRKMMDEYHHAEQTTAALQENPIGLLRVTAPPAYTAHLLSEKIPAFLQAYPDIQLELNLTGELLDFIEHKIDVGIRLTHTPPENLVAKLIGHYQLQVCASVEYLKQHGEPKTPQQLKEHPCLVYATEVVSQRWPFVMDGKEMAVYVTPRLSSNLYETILQSVKHNCGIARLPSYVIKEEVEKNNLKLLLKDYLPMKIPIYAIYQQTIYKSPMVHAFVEFLQQCYL